MLKRLSNPERLALIVLLAVAVTFTGMHYLLSNQSSNSDIGTAFYEYDYKVLSAAQVEKAHKMFSENGVFVSVIDAHGRGIELTDVKPKDLFVSLVNIDSNKVVFTKQQLD